MFEGRVIQFGMGIALRIRSVCAATRKEQTVESLQTSAPGYSRHRDKFLRSKSVEQEKEALRDPPLKETACICSIAFRMSLR
jgi:hypothetical protein